MFAWQRQVLDRFSVTIDTRKHIAASAIDEYNQIIRDGFSYDDADLESLIIKETIIHIAKSADIAQLIDSVKPERIQQYIDIQHRESVFSLSDDIARFSRMAGNGGTVDINRWFDALDHGFCVIPQAFTVLDNLLGDMYDDWYIGLDRKLWEPMAARPLNMVGRDDIAAFSRIGKVMSREQVLAFVFDHISDKNSKNDINRNSFFAAAGMILNDISSRELMPAVVAACEYDNHSLGIFGTADYYYQSQNNTSSDRNFFLYGIRLFQKCNLDIRDYLLSRSSRLFSDAGKIEEGLFRCKVELADGDDIRDSGIINTICLSPFAIDDTTLHGIRLLCDDIIAHRCKNRNRDKLTSLFDLIYGNGLRLENSSISRCRCVRTLSSLMTKIHDDFGKDINYLLERLFDTVSEYNYVSFDSLRITMRWMDSEYHDLPYDFYVETTGLSGNGGGR